MQEPELQWEHIELNCQTQLWVGKIKYNDSSTLSNPQLLTIYKKDLKPLTLCKSCPLYDRHASLTLLKVVDISVYGRHNLVPFSAIIFFLSKKKKTSQKGRNRRNNSAKIANNKRHTKAEEKKFSSFTILIQLIMWPIWHGS